MGISITEAMLLREWFASWRVNGPALTLGVADIRFTSDQYASATGSVLWKGGRDTPSAAEFFASIGVDELLSLDVSDYEGADLLFDLNERVPPADLIDRFGLIVNVGTLEHIFHVPNALSNITRMLRVGGMVAHILPAHNAVDHGFYQFGPTLMLDYYAAAGFEILESAALIFDALAGVELVWTVAPAQPGAFGMGLLGACDDRCILHVCAVRKHQDSITDPIPTQSIYSTGSRRLARPRWFAPYRSQNGHKLPGREPLSVSLGDFRPYGEKGWTSPLPSTGTGDDGTHPVRSLLALYEDDELLGPPHAMHSAIQSRGGGLYSHWDDTLYFSTSDGSDPNTNGRFYRAIVPHLVLM